jgi:hypothetical protein
MSKDSAAMRDAISGGIGIGQDEHAKIDGWFEYWLHDENGVLVAHGREHNIMPNVGLQYLMDSGINGTLYNGLLASSPTVNSSSTMGTISQAEGNYSEATRPTWTKVRASQTMSNSASKSRFTFTGADTIGGGFVTTSSTKAGTAGTLVAGKAFSGGNLAVANGYTLDIQYDITTSSS